MIAMTHLCTERAGKFARIFFVAVLAVAAPGLSLQSSTVVVTVQQAGEQEEIKRSIETANNLLRQGNFREAIPYYELALKQRPTLYSIHNLIGFCYTQLNELQTANQYFTKAVQLQPNFLEARNNLGANYLALNQPQKAALEFESVLQHEPDNLSALYNLASARMKLGQWNQALASLLHAHTLAPSDVQLSIDLVEAQLKNGRAQAALALVGQLLASSKEDAMLRLSLGLVLVRNNQFEIARPLIKSATSLAPELVSKILSYANELYNKGEYQGVVDLLGSMDRQQMENSSVWHGMIGYTYYKLDKIELAINELQQAIKLDPLNEDYYLDLGEVFGANRAYYAAVALFEAATKVLPNSEKLEFALALSHQLGGNSEKCVEILQDILKKTPHFEPAYKVLAESYDGAEEWDKLVEVAKQIQQLNEQNYWGWYFEAKAKFELARLKAVDFDEAEKILIRAIKLQPTAPDGNFLLGKLRASQGRYPEALKLFTAVIQINPNYAPAHYHLANVYKQMGQKELSKKEFEIHDKLKKEEKTRLYRALLVEIRRS